MGFIESAVYFLLAIGANVLGLYYAMTGLEPDACALSIGFCLVLMAWVLARLWWLDGASARRHKRRMKQIDKEIDQHKRRL